jgi:S-adenosyl-L-methionine methyltransferase
MSRLDSFIRRMQAQRTVIDWAVGEIAGQEGLVLELGLGNGRTFDHLREKLPGREIYAFDFAAKANPKSLPAADRLILGDTLPVFRATHGAGAVLTHVDASMGVEEIDRVRLAWLPAEVAALTVKGGIIISGWALTDPGLLPLPLPEGVPEGRYFCYRRV